MAAGRELALLVVTVVAALVALPRLAAAQDTTPPTVFISPSSGYTATSPTLTIEVHGCDDQSDVSDAILSFNGGGLPYSQSSPASWCSGGPSSLFTTTVTLQPGTNTFNAVVCDAYGNCRPASATYTYTPNDATPPMISFSPASAHSTADQALAVGVGGCDTQSAVTSATLTLNGVTVSSSAGGSVGGCAGPSRVFNAALWLTPGANALDASVCDAAGNCASGSATYYYYPPPPPDEEPPTITFSPASGTQVSEPTLTIAVLGCDALSTVSDAILSFNGNGLPYTEGGTVAGCTGPSSVFTTTVTLQPGANTLVATVCDYAGNCAPASATYAYVGPSVRVTPDGAPVSVAPGTSASQTFTVTNEGTANATFTLAASCSGAALASSPCAPNSTSVTLGPGDSTAVTVSFQTVTPAAGTTVVGTVVLTATHSGVPSVQDQGSVAVSVAGAALRGVSITPVSATTITQPANTTVAHPFTVTNTGSSTASFAMAVSCSGAGIVSGSCAVSPGTVSLAAGADTTVTVTFQTAGLSGGGTGVVTLQATHASDASVTGQGTVTVPVAPLGAPSVLVDVRGANAGTTLEKSQCLAFGLVADVARECGVLRVTHGLPAVRTYGTGRAPTLVYYYDQAAGHADVGVHITRTANAPLPQNVRTTLYDRSSGGAPVQVGQRVDAGSHWSIHGHRVVLPWTALDAPPSRILPYRVRVEFQVGGQWQQAAPDVDGELVVVRRALARGWHVAGVEELYPQSTGALLWVGGDGSTRTYVQHGTVGGRVRWVTDTVTRPDSILQAPGGEYVRILPGGVQLVFDVGGRHVRTEHPHLGPDCTTHFSYVSGTRRLSQITVPPSSAGLAYLFHYGADGALDSISAPGVKADSARVTRLAYADRVARAVNGITDPDGHDVQFELASAPAAPGLITARIDRRDTRTALDPDPAGLTLGVASTALDSGMVATHTFVSGRGRSAAPTAGPLPLDSVYLRYDGPRLPSDVADVTRFWLNRLGAPDSVRNALGQVTRLERTHPHFPGHVTRLQRPDTMPGGVVSRATYTARGNLESVTTESPLGAGSGDAVTQYTWDTTWDRPTVITATDAPTTYLTYDPATGNLVTQRVGPDAARAVTFGYHANGLPHTVSVQGRVLETLEHDAALGNLARTRTPRGIETRFERDRLGRDTLTRAPIQAGDTLETRQRWDVMDRVWETETSAPAVAYTLLGGVAPDTAAVPALTLTVTTTFDAEGNPERVASLGSGPSDVTPTYEYTYDRLNRLLTRNQGAGPRAITYDPAGNVVATRNAGGSTVTQEYDALNRLTRRVLPARTHTRRTCDDLPTGPITGPAPGCFVVFPYFPNDGGTGYRVSEDTEDFAYDAAGNLVQADNWAARIRRAYYPNGLLKADTTRLGMVTSPSTSDVTYAQQYSYDLAGRRTELRWGANTISYAYHPFGALERITDPTGARYAWTYDAEGRPTVHTVSPASGGPGVIDTLTYDADGRLHTRIRRSTAAGLGVLNTDILSYDLRGKVIEAATDSRALAADETHRLAYDGLGAVLAAQRVNGNDVSDLEEFRNDAFGNVLYSRTRSTAWGVGAPQTSYYFPSGELYRRQAVLPGAGQLPPEAVREDLHQAFGPGGNLAVSSLLRQDANTAEWLTQTAARSYYDAADRLVAVQRYVHNAQALVNTGAWEEHRYDALGRKVLTHVRRDASSPPAGSPWGTNRLCTSSTPGVCSSYVERTRWDGAQILAETRTAVGSSNASNQGEVNYVHGPGMDQPLAVLTTAGARVLNYSWRGLPESSVWADGSAADCALTVGTCSTLVQWPSRAGAYYRPVLDGGTSSSVVPTWLGSLTENGAGASGLLYRRNRYYDPVAGRFTQQDPIGLAGGINAYGFASGDPVSYRDPFGLSAEDVSVNCRAVGDSGEGNAAHCAVRVVDESRDLDVTIELLNENWTNEVYWRSRAGDAEAQGYNPGRWARVAVPVGMTSHEFDDRVLQQAMLHTRAARGQDYHFWGGSNSNRFVFNIITSAGGMVPGAASRAFKIAPGICGGGGLSRGGQCSP